MGAGRLENDGRHVLVPLQHLRQCLDVRLQLHHRARRRRGDPARALVDNDVVVPTVEVAFELHQLVFAGVGAGQVQGHQGGLRAGGDEAYLLGAWHQALNRLTPADLELRAAP